MLEAGAVAALAEALDCRSSDAKTRWFSGKALYEIIVGQAVLEMALAAADTDATADSDSLGLVGATGSESAEAVSNSSGSGSASGSGSNGSNGNRRGNKAGIPEAVVPRVPAMVLAARPGLMRLRGLLPRLLAPLLLAEQRCVRMPLFLSLTLSF